MELGGWTSLLWTDARGYAPLTVHISFDDMANRGPDWLVRTWTKARSNEDWPGYDWSLGYCYDSYYTEYAVHHVVAFASTIFEHIQGQTIPKGNLSRSVQPPDAVQVTRFLPSGIPALSAWRGLSVSPLI